MAVVALTMAVYSRALAVGFFSDDMTWLARLDATRANPEFLLTIFGRDFTPLFHLSLLVDFLVGGTLAWPFHASSIAVHAGCIALLFQLLRRLGTSPPVAAIASATWALNVRVSEAVIWPAARCHSLAALFLLAALVVVAGRSRHRIAASTFLLVLGILCKETAIAGVVLAPLFLRREPATESGFEGERGWRSWLVAWPFAALGVGFVAFNALAKPSLASWPESAEQWILELPFILLRPLGLGDLYGFDWPGFVAVTTLVLLLALLLRNRLARLGLAWLVVFMILVMPLEKLSSRYLYVLAIGHALLLCGLLEQVAPRLVTASLRRVAAALGLVAAACVLIANILFIQREIDDYEHLASRYDACLSVLRPLAGLLEEDVTVIVIDESPRDAVARMFQVSWERGGIVKLIPDRAAAPAGLVPLADALNIGLSGRGAWAIPGPGAASSRHLVYVFDGVRLRRRPPGSDARGIVFAAHLGSFEELRAAEKRRDGTGVEAPPPESR